MLLVIGFGFMYVNPANWTPFIPREHRHEFGQFGWSGIVRGAGVIFFAYIGFDAVSPRRRKRRTRSATCRSAFSARSRLHGALHPDGARHDGPGALHEAQRAASGVRRDRRRRARRSRGSRYLVNIGAIAGLASVVLVMLMGQPRIFYSMARDGLLPPVFGKVHPKFQTPYITTIITGMRRGAHRRVLPDRAARRAGVDRDAARLRDRVRRRAGAALPAPEHPAAVPDAAGSARADPRHPHLRLHDVLVCRSTRGSG